MLTSVERASFITVKKPLLFIEAKFSRLSSVAGNGRSVGLGVGVVRRGQLQGVVGVSSSVGNVWFLVAEVICQVRLVVWSSRQR